MELIYKEQLLEMFGAKKECNECKLSGIECSRKKYSIGEFCNAIDCCDAVDAVPRPVLDQIRWERDMAMTQLEEIGVGFCEKADDVVKVVRCKDCEHSMPNDGRLVKGLRYCMQNLDGNNNYASVFDDDYCSSAERKDIQEEL